MLLADSVDTYKMNLTDFSPETIKKFKETFPPFYVCSNPMDMTGSGKMSMLSNAMRFITFPSLSFCNT